MHAVPTGPCLDLPCGCARRASPLRPCQCVRSTHDVERAASTTVDDRALLRSQGWRSVRATKAYKKTLSKATKKG